MPRTLCPPGSCNVYTPSVLADAVVLALGDFSDARWLEPCVGKGAFLQALARHGVEAKRIIGTDLASTPEPTDRLGRVRRSTEFLEWSMKTTHRFDRIVANPPFIALSGLDARVQKAALQHETPEGSKVTLSGNCWHAFLCASLRLLKRNGSIAFILPAAYEYANYARSLRLQLPSQFSDIRVHRCRTPLFEDAEDGSVVVIAKGYQTPPEISRRFIHNDLQDLVCGIPKRHLNSDDLQIRHQSFKRHNTVPLSSVMSIGIGAVTGDADYFLMNEAARIGNSLPLDAMIRVVSKSRHVYSGRITRNSWNDLLNVGERVWLFRPDGTTLQKKSVRRYLDKPTEAGGCRRTAYKIRNREPWYQTPMPLRPHGFLTGMSQYGPVVCFNRMNGLAATNTLYTVRFPPGRSRREQIGWAMMLLTTAVREQLQELARAYPLGLPKLEPGDLKAIEIPRPRNSLVSESHYDSAVKALHDGDLTKSEAIAERYISSPGRTWSFVTVPKK